MPTLDTVIDDIVAGDARQLTRTVTDIPTNESATDAWLTIKEHPDDSDAAAIIQKAITTTNADGTGQITDAGSGSPWLVTLRFDLTSADTALLTPGRRYHYDIQVKTDDATLNIYTPEKGQIKTVQGVTTTTT